MTTIMPEGEEIRKAVRWISEERCDFPDKSLAKIIEQAAVKFNLSPVETEFLSRFFKQ